MRLTPSVLFVALAAVACTSTTPLPPRTVGPDAAIGGGAFNTGTRVGVAAETFREAGKVAVCAAWAADDVTAMASPTCPRC